MIRIYFIQKYIFIKILRYNNFVKLFFKFYNNKDIDNLNRENFQYVELYDNRKYK